MSNGKDLIKIPIRSLDEYKIRYSQDKNKHAGQGKGDSKVGDVLGRAGGQQKAPGKGQGKLGISQVRTIMKQKYHLKNWKRISTVSWSCRIWSKKMNSR